MVIQLGIIAEVALEASSHYLKQNHKGNKALMMLGHAAQGLATGLGLMDGHYLTTAAIAAVTHAGAHMIHKWPEIKEHFTEARENKADVLKLQDTLKNGPKLRDNLKMKPGKPK